MPHAAREDLPSHSGCLRPAQAVLHCGAKGCERSQNKGWASLDKCSHLSPNLGRTVLRAHPRCRFRKPPEQPEADKVSTIPACNTTTLPASAHFMLWATRIPHLWRAENPFRSPAYSNFHLGKQDQTWQEQEWWRWKAFFLWGRGSECSSQ